MPAAEHDIPTKIFLGNLSFDTDEKKLKEVFGKMGPITEILLMKDRESGLSRGFGFITYENVSDAKDAVSRLNERELDGKQIKVDMALKGIKQLTASRGGGMSGRGMDRGRGGYRGRGGPPSSRGCGHDSGYERPYLSGPSGRGSGGPGRGGRGGVPSGRGGGPSGRGGYPGRGGRGGAPSRGGHPPSRGGPYPTPGGPLLDRDDYPRGASAPPRGGKEPLLSAPPPNAMGDYRLRGYNRGYEREPDPRRETLLSSRGAPPSRMPEYDRAPRSAYDPDEAIPQPRRRAYPEDDYGAAPASARPSRSSYDEPAPDPYARERYPPEREEPPLRAYPERDGYSSREARDPYAPPARDSYSSAAASRPPYDYSLPASREAPAPATARTASRYEDDRGALIPRGYERPTMREYGAERVEPAYSRDYDREAAPSRPSVYSDQYSRAPARPVEHEYAGSSSSNPRYDPYASRDSYAEARSARPEKSPYGARDSYGSPALGGRGAYPAERVSRPLDRNGGGVPPPSRASLSRAPPPSRGYERY